MSACVAADRGTVGTDDAPRADVHLPDRRVVPCAEADGPVDLTRWHVQQHLLGTEGGTSVRADPEHRVPVPAIRDVDAGADRGDETTGVRMPAPPGNPKYSPDREPPDSSSRRPRTDAALDQRTASDDASGSAAAIRGGPRTEVDPALGEPAARHLVSPRPRTTPAGPLWDLGTRVRPQTARFGARRSCVPREPRTRPRPPPCRRVRRPTRRSPCRLGGEGTLP